MKTNLYVEFQEKQLSQGSIVTMAKKIWSDAGNKASELKNLQVYIKTDENTAYYVFNDDVTGSFSLDDCQ